MNQVVQSNPGLSSTKCRDGHATQALTLHLQPDRYTGHEKSHGQHILLSLQLSSALSQEIIQVAYYIKTNRPTEDRTDRLLAHATHCTQAAAPWSHRTQYNTTHMNHCTLTQHCGADACTTARPLERFSMNQSDLVTGVAPDHRHRSA